MNHTRRRRQVHVRLGNFGALTWFRRRCYGGHQIFADPNRVVFLQIRWKSQEICILTMSFGYIILPWLESTHETYELSKCNLISECGETWRNNPSNDEPDILSSHMPEMRGLHFNRKMTRNPQQILGPITLSVKTVSQKKALGSGTTAIYFLQKCLCHEWIHSYFEMAQWDVDLLHL